MMVVPPQEGLGNNRLSTGAGGHSHGHMSIGNSEASRRYTQDEAELREAARDRSPGQDSSKLLLPKKDGDENDKREVDVMHMTRTQRDILVKRVLETADQEALALLKKLHDRREKAGVPYGTVEVRFEDLTVTAPIGVGSSGLPTVTNSYLGSVYDLLAMLHIKKRARHDFTILSSLNGRIPPGRICLLLGPPGSGKSTLLEALAGKVDEGGARKRTGSITYNGATFDRFVPERTSAYVTQYDEHMAELTVRETLDFSRRVQGAGNRPAEMEALKKAEQEQGLEPDPELAAFMKANTLEGKRESVHTDFILRIMGLDVCADTQVGSSMVRGISGGQKKRVTTSEMICGPKRTLFMDEISTGLDSATTFQIVRNLRDFAHLADATVMVALLQPAPEVFDLFDDVMLLSEGHMLFHGPCKEVMPFFKGLGFDIPERKGIPDFMQEVSGLRDQRAYWVRNEPYRFVPVTEMSEAFRNSKVGKQNQAAMEKPFEQTDISNEALITQRYALNRQQELIACFQREWTLIKRTSFIYVFKTFQVFLMAIITATLWLRTQTHPISVPDASKYAAYTFFTIIVLIFNGIAEMSIAIERLPIFAKQRDNMFYRAVSYVLPVTIMRLPYSALEALVWANITYWEINMAPLASRYFMFLVLCFLIHQWSVGFFRMVGAIFRNLTISNSVGLFGMLVFLLCGGFVITKHSIHPWVVWLYWISPIQYAQRAFLINEFTAQRWQGRIYATAGPYAGQSLGNGVLASYGFPHEYKWVWIGACYLVFCCILFNVVIILAHQYLGAVTGSAPVKSEEQLMDHEEALYGEKASHLQERDGEAAVDMSKQGSMRSSRRVMGTSQRVRGSRKDVHLGGNSKSTLEEGKTSGENHGPPNGGGDIELGKARKSGAASMRSRVSGDEDEEGEGQAMSLPYEPCTLTFDNLHYMVPLPSQMQDSPSAISGPNGRELELLKGISGAFRPQTLTALMGVTGAGKTTLMDVLAGRKTGGRIEGDIRLNGHPKVQDTFARVSGYVEQTDIHDAYTTVHEAVRFSAHLRINGNPPNDRIEQFVEEVMSLVELEPLRTALVGKPGSSGLSVEQRKRLTIAVELVANPSIIFMDEPTSGLDARAANIVMRCVKSIVQTGRTIVSTIHQPSIDIFEQFDELVLLKRGGETIYCGPLGTHSKDLIAYFEAVQGVPKVEKGINPATWMLEVSSVGAESRTGINFTHVYADSKFAKDYQEVINEYSSPKEGSEPLHFDSMYAVGMAGQYKWLTWRYFITYWRTTEYNAVRFLLTIFIAVCFGFVMWALGGRVTTQNGIFTSAGALYASTVFIGIINSISVQPIISQQRGVMYREKAAGTYAIWPWYCGIVTLELLYGSIQTIIFSCVLYFASGFARRADKFWWFTLFLWFTLLWWTLFGMTAVALTPNVKVSAVVSSNFYSLANLFAGFVAPRPTVPGWWVWMSWVCPETYMLWGLVASQVGDYGDQTTITATGEVTTPRQFIKEVFGYRTTFLGQCVAILCCWMIALFFMSYCAFRYINFLKR